MVFDTAEYPALQSKTTTKRTAGGANKMPDTVTTTTPPRTLTATELWTQILADMKQDIAKLVTTELASMQGELTSHLTKFKAAIHSNMNNQIAELLQTIQVLNQHFLEAMDHLPPSLPTRNQKGWALSINAYMHWYSPISSLGRFQWLFLTPYDTDDDIKSISSTSSHNSTIQSIPPVPTNLYQSTTPIPRQTSLIQTLRGWLQPAQTPILQPAPAQPNSIPPTITITSQALPKPSIAHQLPLQRAPHNQHWGDPMIHPKPFNTFQVLSCNVNTLSTQLDYTQWKAASHVINSSKANAVSFQEPNIAWNKHHKHRICQIMQHPTGHAIISTTISTEVTTGPTQCGGTIQAIMGDWVSCSVRTGQDNTGLGWWSFIKLQGLNDKQYILLSGYWVWKNQHIDLGSNNTYSQQYQLLHQQGNWSPDPHTQFLDDLIALINKWRWQQKAVLLCLDANKNPQGPSSTGITHLFDETDLIDLHSHKHPHQCHPLTYNCGTQPIDICAGSIKFANALLTAWYLPFGKLVGLKGGHHTLGLVQHLYAVPTASFTCNENSEYAKLMQKFCKYTIQECQQANINGQIHALTDFEELLPEHRQELKALDQEITHILVAADKQCVKSGNAPWSLQLHEVYSIHHYWSLKLSHFQTGWNYPNAFWKIKSSISAAKLHLPILHPYRLIYGLHKLIFVPSTGKHKKNSKHILTNWYPQQLHVMTNTASN